MSELQRWEYSGAPEYFDSFKCETSYWVRSEDVEKLEAEVERLREENAVLLEWGKKATGLCGPWCRYIGKCNSSRCKR